MTKANLLLDHNTRHANGLFVYLSSDDGTDGTQHVCIRITLIESMQRVGDIVRVQWVGRFTDFTMASVERARELFDWLEDVVEGMT